MGYNTVVMFLNDNIDRVQKNPGEVIDAIHSRAIGNDRTWVPFGTTVLPSRHADDAQVIIAGANTLKVLANVHWHRMNDPVEIVRAIAREHGFKVAITKPPKT